MYFGRRQAVEGIQEYTSDPALAPTASKARQEFSDTLDRVVSGRERIILARRGRDLAAIVPIDDLELIRALEDRIDLEKAKKALREEGSVPWKKVKADLGL